MHARAGIVLCCLMSVWPLVSPCPAITVADLSGIRSVCNYLLDPGAHDVATWAQDLDRTQQHGFNTLWMVHVWADYQPSVDPPQWREDRIDALRGICSAARDRGMNMILPLAYIGEGWGPQGVDVPVWPLVETHRQQHLTFLRRMASELRDFDNVIYLLCSEEILPATLLYTPTQRPECVESFRAWAREANPDVDYWNARWGTAYTWENLSPPDISNRPQWQLWADHARWCAALMRRLLPPMVAAIRAEHPDALIGFHDFLMPEKALGLTAQDGALELPSPFDFYSIGYYYQADLENGVQGNLQKLAALIARARELYPGFPLFVGELGMAVRTAPEHRAADEALQADFLSRAVALLQQEGLGVSLWAWRTVVPGAETTMSLIREDGTETPALAALTRLWKRQ